MCIYVHTFSFGVSGGMRGGVEGKGVRGEKEEGCCVTTVCPESFAPPKCFQVCAASDWLPQIREGDGGTRVHTQGKTRTRLAQGLERKIRGGTGGWRRGSKENTSQKKSRSAFPSAWRSILWEDSRGQMYVHSHGSIHLFVY